MPYGTVKVDNITFDSGGADQNVTVSGIHRAITSGVTVTGTISGAVLIGTTTVSGATVTGTIVQGTTVQGVSGTFTSLTGTTTTGTTANFVSGVFTTRVSGTTITGNTGQFTSGTFVSLTGTTITGTTINAVTVSSTTGTFGSITGTTITGTTINGASVNATTGNFTSLTGVTVTGTTAQFVSGVFTTQVSGLTVTGTQSSFTSGNFITLSGATATFTSGVIASGTAAAPSLSILGDPNTGIYSPGADQVAISTGGAGRLFVDASGNVGVGTSAPTTGVLVIKGGANQLALEAVDSATYGRLDIGHFTNGAFIGTAAGTGPASNLLRFGTSATERMRITSAGNVGIGTSTPANTLHVQGAALIGQDAANQTNVTLNAGGPANTRTLAIYYQSGGINGSVSGDYGLIQAAYSGVSNAPLALNPSGGNVGIGTTSPGVSLDVNGTIRSLTGQLDLDNASQFKVLGLYHSGVRKGFVSYDNTANVLSVFGEAAGSQLGFHTANSERARIDSSGNVGIGTSAPSDILSVVKTDTSNSLFDSDAAITITNLNSDAFGRSTNLNFNQGTDASSGRLASIAGVYTNFSTSVGGALAFSTNNGSGTVGERLRITSAGNVGIGTTSPAVPLDIVGQVRTTDSTVDLRLLPLAASSVGIVGTISNHALSFFTNNTERARIDSSGRLLVGTSSARAAGGNFGGSTNQILFETVDIAAFTAVGNKTDASGPFLVLAKSRSGTIGGNTIVQNNDILGSLVYAGANGTTINDVAAKIEAQVDGTPGANDMPGRLVFSTTADGAASPTERMRITSAGVLQIADAGNITVGTTTGTKIGTATTQKLGFYNATPVVQPAAVANATDAASVITQLNDLLAKLRTLGIIAT